MSASSKKKLRREQDAAKLTERQLQEQKEAKKLNLYTTAFVAVLALLLVAAVTVGTVNFVKGSGIRERNTIALTVGDHKISNAELNYYYTDSINNFVSYYGSYASLMGLETGKPLNEQVINEDTGLTWADDFLNSAMEDVKAVYAVVDAAEAAGFTLTEEHTAQVDSIIQNMEMYAMMYGYTDVETYLKGMYGPGADMDSYRKYCSNAVLADAYSSNYSASLTYEDADLRAHEAEDFDAYSSYSYNYYYLAANKFLEGGTTNEDGTTTYSDEENAAAVAAAEEIAKSLTSEEVADLTTLDKLISELSINAESETPVTSIACDDYRRSSVMGVLSDWITDESRKEGDLAYLPNVTTSTDEEGNEVSTTNGYYVVFYRGYNDNTFPLVNVRHILVGFEGGTYDANTGLTNYTEEEKKAAWAAAEEILESWKSGDATEESFAALANEKSTDTGSNTTGGLYESIYPGQMVEPFEDWCYAEHVSGDTGLVESTFGVHIMYYVGEAQQTYRDFMITSTLRNNDATEWYDALVEAMTVVEGNTKYINKALVVSAG